MKKNLMLLFIFVGIFFINLSGVSASKVTCKYKYKLTEVTVTYEYGRKVVSSANYLNGNKSNVLKKVNVNNSDFYNGTNLVCPKMKVSTKMVGKNKYDLTLSASKEGDLEGTINIVVADDKEKGGAPTNPPECTYRKGTDLEFILVWDGTTVVPTLSGKKIKDYTVSIKGTPFTTEDFKENSCPENIHDQFVHRAKNVIISKDPILLDVEGTVDAAESQQGVREVNKDLNIKINFTSGCAVISDDLNDWLIQLLDMVKIAALVLTLILGMLDFLKGTFSGEADAMKKVWKNFSRRLMAVALLFLLPVIIGFLLNLVSINGVDTNNPLCLR